METSRKLYSYIAAQCLGEKEKIGIPGFVTISRQSGAGGITVGEKLAVYLNEQAVDNKIWSVFDKNLVDEIIKDNNLPERLMPFLKETPISVVEDALEELLGVHPPQATLVEKSNQTIIHLARRGRVILVGRGAPVITRFTEGGVHVRLVGSIKKRKDHIKEYFKLDDKAAGLFIEREDEGRAWYFKKYFNRNIDDPLNYDIVLNTDTVAYDEAARIIGDMVTRKINLHN